MPSRFHFPRIVRPGYLFFGLFSAALAYFLGNSYGQRLSQHEGYFLVSVEDEIRAPRPAPPRHTVVVVVDGLRKDAALAMKSTRYLMDRGRCFTSDVGNPTISRPLYAVISTGLEQDRTGSRDNDQTRPLRAESIWEVAREAGMQVSGVSELPWWRELFPGGFDYYYLLPRYTDYFGPTVLTDLTLIHPVYVDEDGHSYGAASPEYRSSVFDRLDGDFLPFLQKLDLSQDLVILTADHGHVDRGGHGGRQPEVASVLTCFAGRGVIPGAEIDSLDIRSLAPALSLLLGLRFPREMRALEDDLDVLFTLLAPETFSEAYRADRRAAVERYRSENLRQLQEWIGTRDASFRALYARARAAQYGKMVLALLALGLGLFLYKKKRNLGLRETFSLLGVLAAVCGGTCAAYYALTGSLDFTSINARGTFIRDASLVCILVGVGALLLRWRLGRDATQLLRQQEALVGIALFVNAAHIFVYGWPMGFPVPGPFLFFLPYLASVFLLWHALFLAILSVGVREEGAFPPPRA